MNARAEGELLQMVLRGEMKTAAIRRARNTRLGYAADFASFSAWCREHSYATMPAESTTVLLYSHALLEKGRKVSTAIRHLSAINAYHRDAGLTSPATGQAWQFLLAVRRMRGEQPSQKQALRVDQLRQMCASLPHSAKGWRDRSVLTLGFGSALRRSNLIALDLEDLEFRHEGLVLTIRTEKQNRRGGVRHLGIARGTQPETCPVGTLQAWVEEWRGKEPGPLFTPTRGGRVQIQRLQSAHIARIVKAAALRIGLDPKEWAGHSMRAGFVTSCINAGLPDLMVMAHTAHRDLSTLRIYHRRASDPFVGNPSGLLGL